MNNSGWLIIVTLPRMGCVGAWLKYGKSRGDNKNDYRIEENREESNVVGTTHRVASRRQVHESREGSLCGAVGCARERAARAYERVTSRGGRRTNPDRAFHSCQSVFRLLDQADAILPVAQWWRRPPVFISSLRGFHTFSHRGPSRRGFSSLAWRYVRVRAFPERAVRETADCTG